MAVQGTWDKKLGSTGNTYPCQLLVDGSQLVGARLADDGVFANASAKMFRSRPTRILVISRGIVIVGPL